MTLSNFLLLFVGFVVPLLVSVFLIAITSLASVLLFEDWK